MDGDTNTCAGPPGPDGRPASASNSSDPFAEAIAAITASGVGGNGSVRGLYGVDDNTGVNAIFDLADRGVNPQSRYDVPLIGNQGRTQTIRLNGEQIEALADALDQLPAASTDRGETFLAIQAGTTVSQLQQQLTEELGDLVTQQDAQRLADQVFGSANDCACAVIVDIAPLYEEVLVRAQVQIFTASDVRDRMLEVLREEQRISNKDFKIDESPTSAFGYLSNYEFYQNALSREFRNTFDSLPQILNQELKNGGGVSDEFGNLALGISRLYLGGSLTDIESKRINLNNEDTRQLDKINANLTKNLLADTSIDSVSINDPFVKEVERRIGQIIIPITSDENGDGVIALNEDGVPIFDKDHPKYHEYFLSSSCSKIEKGCNFENAKAGLLRHPAPSAPGSSVEPIQDEQVGYAFPFGDVRHEVYDDGEEIINVTLDGHFLAPGIVRRYITQDDSRIYINTYGEGTGNFGGINNAGSNSVWGSVDNNIFDYMRSIP